MAAHSRATKVVLNFHLFEFLRLLSISEEGWMGRRKRCETMKEIGPKNNQGRNEGRG